MLDRSNHGNKKRQRKTKSQREWRERDNAGGLLVYVPISLRVLEWLLDIGWLDESDLWTTPRPSREDKRRIGEAISRGLEASARAARKNL